MNILEKTIEKVIDAGSPVYHQELKHHEFELVQMYDFGSEIYCHYRSENTDLVGKLRPNKVLSPLIDVYLYRERSD